MKKVFRILLLVAVSFAIYGGFVSHEWSYPIGIIMFSFICFLGTLNGKKSSKSSNTSSAVFGGNEASNASSGSDCGGSDAGC